VWVDINNDGWLDLFVGNEGQSLQLFLNNGDGTFKDISASAGIQRVMFTKGVTAGDYDNDGFPDLYVSNFSGSNVLFHNNHDNTFTEVTETAGVPGSGRGFATWFFDYDNDGLPDIFATSYFLSLDETARTYLNLPHNATTLKLYKNVGNGKFRDVTTEVGLDKVYMPMGANFGDIDNDGFLDIFLGTGTPSYVTLKPSVLLHNKAGKKFVDVTTSSGTGEWHRGHAVAFADLDNRGDEDIVFEVGGATPGDSHALRVFENPGHGNDWISLKLVGTKTNRAAIGARIKLTVENKGQGTRSIYRTVGSGGSFGASPLQQHIGLGKDARILDLEVWWPASNTRQHFSNVEKDQFLEIKEFAQQYAKLERKPYRLGGARRNGTVVATAPATVH
jgi:FG-GAP-like repeat/ASPIC and UnbV